MIEKRPYLRIGLFLFDLKPHRGCSTSNRVSQGVYSKTVLVHNASPVKLKYYQFWPSLIRTGGTVGAEALGFSASVAGQWVPRNSADHIEEGVLDPWPRVGGAGRIKYECPPPDPEKLSTKVMWQDLCLTVYTGVGGAAVVHVKFECAAANHVILLDGVEKLTCRPREEMETVRRLAGLSA